MVSRASRFCILFLLLSMVLAFGTGPTPAHAFSPDPALSLRQNQDARCDDELRLAGIVGTEARNQSGEAQFAIAAIVAREAASRDMSICALSEKTNFVTVYHFAEANPETWQAQFFEQPPAWAVAIARAVLSGLAGDDVRRGAMHFDGAPCAGALWVSGQIHFCE